MTHQLNILVWWEVCWNLCGMQIHSSHPSSSRTVQELRFQINSCSPWVLELKDVSDMWIIWNLFMQKLTLWDYQNPVFGLSLLWIYSVIKSDSQSQRYNPLIPTICQKRKRQFSAEKCTIVSILHLDCKFWADTGYHWLHCNSQTNYYTYENSPNRGPQYCKWCRIFFFPPGNYYIKGINKL